MKLLLRQAGFTLIELLVVIGILSVLMVVMLGFILESQQGANEFACQANLGFFYKAIKSYETKFKSMPRGGGAAFIHDLWKRRVLEHTEQNRDRFFCPEVMKVDGRLSELKEMDIDEIWLSRDDFSSIDTNYAARASQFYRGMNSGREAWMADDNEGALSHVSGTINILYGDGSVKGLARAVMEEKEEWPLDDPDFFPEVGPNSPVKDLRKLSID